MLEVSLSLEKSDIAALNLVQGQDAMFKKAAARALNKTARWLKPYLAKQVSGSLNIKQSLIKPGIFIVSARPNNLKSNVNLDKHFGVINVNNLGKVKPNDAGVKVGLRQYDDAFQSTMPSGHVGVFKRKRRKRLQIVEQTFVYTGKLAEFMREANDGLAQQQLKKIFIREYRHLAKGTR